MNFVEEIGYCIVTILGISACIMVNSERGEEENVYAKNMVMLFSEHATSFPKL